MNRSSTVQSYKHFRNRRVEPCLKYILLFVAKTDLKRILFGNNCQDQKTLKRLVYRHYTLACIYSLISVIVLYSQQLTRFYWI